MKELLIFVKMVVGNVLYFNNMLINFIYFSLGLLKMIL